MVHKQEDSLKKRYLYKLSTNLVGLAINLVIQAIVPRGLGPKAYGDFHFLSNFFSRVAGFLNMGTSIGFFTKLSQRPKDHGLVVFYMYFSGIAFFIIIGLVVMSHLTSIYEQILPDQKLKYIYMAALFGIFTWIVQVLHNMADAYGVTASSEIARILQKCLGLFLILVLFVLQKLNLTNFFFYHYFILIFLAAAFIVVMEKKGFSLRQSWRLSSAKINQYTKEFYSYSHPLFIYSLIGMVVGILDRWILQYFAGSVEQGFFGFSYQIGAICFLCSGAMTPLITREFSIAFGKKDLNEMARLFRRYIPLLYSIAAYFSCFVALQAEKVIYIFGGSNYKGAAMAVTIMAFYPIHQTYGQLSGSVFYATGHTGLYRNIGIIFMLIGLPVAYFMIAPADRMGAGAGATGLAIKMVLLQFIAVNVSLFYNARLLNLSFIKYFMHQIISLGSMISVSAFAFYLTDTLLGLYDKIIISFLTAGAVYTCITMGIIYFLPQVFGLKRQDIQSIFHWIRKNDQGDES